MNLRQLHYFLAIADEGSFTRAAEQLFVAQPSLSQQIKSLEQELGGALLERLPTGVRLTAAGKAFLPEARSEYTHRRALDDAVRTGVGDIAVGPRPPQWSGPVVELGWEEFVAVLPTSDPLAKRKRPILLEELAERDWVLFGPDHGLSELILEICARAGFTPRRTVETGQVAAATHLVAAGLGVTLVPDNILSSELRAAVRSLKSPLVRQLVAFTRQDWSPLAAAFLEVLQAQAWHPRPASATVVE
jgi:DNA-binding transcriptional LysR family regulator